jgi:hypothetical protein
MFQQAWSIAGSNKGASWLGPTLGVAAAIRCERVWTTSVSFGHFLSRYRLPRRRA